MSSSELSLPVMVTLNQTEADIFDDDGGLGEELAYMTADDLTRRSRLLDTEIRVLKVRNSTPVHSLQVFHALPRRFHSRGVKEPNADCIW